MRTVKADLHNHLQTCKPTCSFNQVIDVAFKSLGEDGVVGLVGFMGDDRYKKVLGFRGYERDDLGNGFYVPEKRVLVIRGQEVFTKQGHLLVLGIEKNKQINDNRKLEDTIKEAKDSGGIIIADHPFFIGGIGAYVEKHPDLLRMIDAIEIHNGNAFFGNKKAQSFYDFYKSHNVYRPGSPFTGIAVSDGHSLAEIGSSYTEIPELDRTNSETLRGSLRYGISHIKGRKMRHSYLTAFNHLGDLACVRILRKLRLDNIIGELLEKEF